MSVKLSRTLKRGMRGIDVQRLQSMLNAVLACDIAVDGAFGSITLKQVKKYQKQRKLAVDGIVGNDTWNALLYDTDCNIEVEENIPEYEFHRELQQGSEGEDVKQLQELLNLLGFNCGSADSIFGSKTKKGVQAAQKKYKLTQDGVARQKTIEALGGVWKPVTDSDGVITICTFNIKRGTYKRGTHKIIGNVIKHSDIVGMQEVTPSGLKNIAKYSKITSYMCATLSNYGHAILTNLSAKDEKITTLSGTGERRKVHHMKIGNVSFYNTHLHYTASSNKTQMKQLVTLLKADRSKVIVLTGDFNRHDFTELEVAGFYQCNKGQSIDNTDGKTSAVNTIDQVFVKGADVLNIWQYEAVSKQHSDHDALFVQIKTK